MPCRADVADLWAEFWTPNKQLYLRPNDEYVRTFKSSSPEFCLFIKPFQTYLNYALKNHNKVFL